MPHTFVRLDNKIVLVAVSECTRRRLDHVAELKQPGGVEVSINHVEHMLGDCQSEATVRDDFPCQFMPIS
jgi:hypothetical protein